MLAPRELTPKLRDRILAALRAGYRRPDVADLAGVHTGHILRWLMRGYKEKTGTYGEFHRAFYAAEREGRLAAITSILRGAASGDWALVLEVMDRSFPQSYGDDGDEVGGDSFLVQAMRKAQPGAADLPSPDDLWRLVWDRLCRDLRRKHGPSLDEDDRSALRRLLSAARQCGRHEGGPRSPP